MPGLPNGFKMVSYSECEEKWMWKLWSQLTSSLFIFFFLTCPIKIISPKNIFISSGMILDNFNVLGETFHFVHFDYCKC
jgi:hypothetical protein